MIDKMRLVVAAICWFDSFLLILQEFIVINDANDGGCGVCGDFDEVHAKAPCEVESVTDGKDAELLAVVANNPDFAGCDFVIYANGSHVKI